MKQDGDIDEPWIMTVKGKIPHDYINSSNNSSPNKKITVNGTKHNSSSSSSSSSASKDKDENVSTNNNHHTFSRNSSEHHTSHPSPKKQAQSPVRPQSLAPAPPVSSAASDKRNSMTRPSSDSNESKRSPSTPDHEPLPHSKSSPEKKAARGSPAKSSARSPCLSFLIYPLISELQRRHHYASSRSSSGESSHKNDAIEELKNAFDLAERSAPGISGQFVKEVVHKLLPAMSESRVNSVVDKMIR